MACLLSHFRNKNEINPFYERVFVYAEYMDEVIQRTGVSLQEVQTPSDRKKFYDSGEWQRMRVVILKRDHHECLWCKARGLVTTAKSATLEIDHIKELEYYPELALTSSNLRTLCHECHNIRHNRSKEKKFDDEIFEF